MSDNTEPLEGLEAEGDETGLKVAAAMHPITGQLGVVLVVNRNGETQNIFMPPEEAHHIGGLMTLNATLVLTMRQVAGMMQQQQAAQTAQKIVLPGR
jgi:hypothetical protein